MKKKGKFKKRKKVLIYFHHYLKKKVLMKIHMLTCLIQVIINKIFILLYSISIEYFNKTFSFQWSEIFVEIIILKILLKYFKLFIINKIIFEYCIISIRQIEKINTIIWLLNLFYFLFFIYHSFYWVINYSIKCQ